MPSRFKLARDVLHTTLAPHYANYHPPPTTTRTPQTTLTSTLPPNTRQRMPADLPLLKRLLADVCVDAVHTHQLSAPAAYVLVYELLLGQGLGGGGRGMLGPAERAVLRHRSELKAAMATLRAKHGGRSGFGSGSGGSDGSGGDAALLAALQPHLGAVCGGSSSGSGGARVPSPHPRWARVNTLKADVGDVLAMLARPPAGWPMRHRTPRTVRVHACMHPCMDG
eukprot:96364-Chlamydomonas_euryale.AAC.2